MGGCLRIAVPLLVIIVALLGTASPGTADSVTWDAFVYHWTRVYTGHDLQDIYNCPADEFNSGNPVEVYLDSGDRLEDKDRFRFTFDGSALSVNRGYIRTVGFSSSVTFDLVLDPGWAVCANVVDGAVVADPYASFTESGFGTGSIRWADNTPSGYTTGLLLGHNNTIRIRKHPTFGGTGSWEQWRTVAPQWLTAGGPDGAAVPECGTLCALGAYFASTLLLRRKK